MASQSAYFRYAPAGVLTGVPAHNLDIGEVVSGRIYEVPAHLAGSYKADGDWKQSTKDAYDTQG